MLLFGDLIKLPHIDTPDNMLTMLLDKSSLCGIPEKLLHHPEVHLFLKNVGSKIANHNCIRIIVTCSKFVVKTVKPRWFQCLP